MEDNFQLPIHFVTNCYAPEKQSRPARIKLKIKRNAPTYSVGGHGNIFPRTVRGKEQGGAI